MTDNEIIKALEWMRDCKCEKISNCDGCPLHKHYPYCDELSAEIALDLINRQKEEIERLTAEANRYKRYYYNHEYDKIKAEARKEFAKRVKKKAASRTYAQILESDLDEVLAEMESAGE